MLILSQDALSKFIPVMGAVIFTDLDECSINSDHRRSFCPVTGELDIPEWQKNSVRELIEKDSLRPWGKRFAELVKERDDCIFGICTSREFVRADFDFMRDHLNIGDSTRILHRETGCEESRESLKHRLFIRAIYGDYNLLMALNLGKMYFFDDKVKNVLEAEALGLIGVLVY
jgi:hypothetical protein